MPGEEASSPETLEPEERRRISARLGAGLVGFGLLGLGTLLIRLEPEQWLGGNRPATVLPPAPASHKALKCRCPYGPPPFLE